ncbi:MAG: NAD(P)/FAD-dependent oxidoreductase [Chloroflexota bacterium]
MFDYDAVIIGGGPAGLTAGLYLGQANRRTIMLDKEGFGGYIKNLELVENYPGFAKGVPGAQLSSEMVQQAAEYGLLMEMAEVNSIELFSSTRWVGCADGKGYTTAVVIIAAGTRRKKLGVPGEEEFMGKGVFHCAMCDGGEFADRVVAVCGGGNAGLTEALYMTKLASKVILIEAAPELTANALLQSRAQSNSKMEIRTGVKVTAMTGNDHLKALELDAGGKKETLAVDGILVDVGIEPNTEYLEGIVPLDEQGRVIVNTGMETEVPYILAAGDVRSGSPCQIATAVGDGALAAITAQRLLQEIVEE